MYYVLINNMHLYTRHFAEQKRSGIHQEKLEMQNSTGERNKSGFKGKLESNIDLLSKFKDRDTFKICSISGQLYIVLLATGQNCSVSAFCRHVFQELLLELVHVILSKQ